MYYDEVVRRLGQFGRYQKRVYLLLCLPVTTSCIQTFLTIFTMAVPDHRCALPGLTNDTFALQSVHHANLLNATLPPQGDSCHLLTSRNVTLSGDDVSYDPIVDAWVNDSSTVSREEGFGTVEEGGNGSRVLVACSRFVYDRSYHTETLVTKMDLVCSKQGSLTTAQMVMMVGSLVGSIVFQPLSDCLGRHKMLMVSLLVHMTSAWSTAWATSSFILLCGCMFLNGLGCIGIFSNGFVIALEMVGPEKRVWAGYVMEMFWSLGMLVLAPLAFLLRDWHHLQLVSAALTLPFLPYFWLIPESPRWLLIKGRAPEAEAILRKAARVNRVALPAGWTLDPVLQDPTRAGQPESQQCPSKDPQVNSGWSAACRNPLLITRYVVLFYTWFVCSLGYYGLSLSMGHLSGDVHVNFVLSGVMELVAFSLCICLLDRVGRRPLNSSLIFLAGLACTSTILTTLYAPRSLQWTTTALALLGKLGISGAFATIWLYSTELFPTVIRNSSMGVSSACARVGSIVSPYIANLSGQLKGEAATAVPLLIFGLSAVVAGLLLLTLPETIHRRLPDTLADAVHFTRVVEEEKELNGFHSLPQEDKPEANDEQISV